MKCKHEVKITCPECKKVTTLKHEVACYDPKKKCVHRRIEFKCSCGVIIKKKIERVCRRG